MPTLTIPYITVDVFTTTHFGGNPLAVILDARGFSDTVMQQIAKEFNYSEVTFVLPPKSPENTAHVRIFTPASELPFAGHPNVGTAFVLGQEGHAFGRPVGDTMRFEEATGIVEVRVFREHSAIVGAAFNVPHPLTIDYSIDPAVIAACASLNVDDIITIHHGPVMASTGLPFAFAEVSGLAALANARPDIAAFTDADARYPHPDIEFSLFLYARTSTGPNRVRARMFAPFDNIPEDPATGSASAALSAYLASLEPADDVRMEIVVEQGVEMGRPSVIELDVYKEKGNIKTVSVKGRCVPMMKGVLQLS